MFLLVTAFAAATSIAHVNGAATTFASSASASSYDEAVQHAFATPSTGSAMAARSISTLTDRNVPGYLSRLRLISVAADTAGTSWADASALDRTVEVGGKSVSILGDVSRSGSSVTIDNIALYGTDGSLVNQVGGRALRDAGGSLLREASGSGVNQVISRGVRAVNSSGKAGHVVNWIATLGDDGSVSWTLGR